MSYSIKVARDVLMRLGQEVVVVFFLFVYVFRDIIPEQLQPFDRLGCSVLLVCRSSLSPAASVTMPSVTGVVVFFLFVPRLPALRAIGKWVAARLL